MILSDVTATDINYKCTGLKQIAQEKRSLLTIMFLGRIIYSVFPRNIYLLSQLYAESGINPRTKVKALGGRGDQYIPYLLRSDAYLYLSMCIRPLVRRMFVGVSFPLCVISDWGLWRAALFIVIARVSVSICLI